MIEEAPDLLERLSSTEDGVTEDMEIAGVEALLDHEDASSRFTVRAIYLAMLKARNGL